MRCGRDPGPTPRPGVPVAGPLAFVESARADDWCTLPAVRDISAGTLWGRVFGGSAAGFELRLVTARRPARGQMLSGTVEPSKFLAFWS